jgi:hypothetical protein
MSGKNKGQRGGIVGLLFSIIGEIKTGKTPVARLVAILREGVEKRVFIPINRDEERKPITPTVERGVEAPGTTKGWFKGELAQHVRELFAAAVAEQSEANLFANKEEAKRVMRELKSCLNTACGIVETELKIKKREVPSKDEHVIKVSGDADPVAIASEIAKNVPGKNLRSVIAALQAKLAASEPAEAKAA